MSRVLGLAAAVAAFNVAAGWWLGRRSDPAGMRAYGWLQAAGILLRAGMIFGVAHMVWRSTRRPAAVAAFLVTAAVLQLAGQVLLHLRGREG